MCAACVRVCCNQSGQATNGSLTFWLSNALRPIWELSPLRIANRWSRPSPPSPSVFYKGELQGDKMDAGARRRASGNCVVYIKWIKLNIWFICFNLPRVARVLVMCFFPLSDRKCILTSSTVQRRSVLGSTWRWLLDRKVLLNYHWWGKKQAVHLSMTVQPVLCFVR